MESFSESDYDAALARIHRHAAESDRGLSSHAPMAADALMALRRGDRIPDFLDASLGAFAPAPEGTPMSDAIAAEAVGVRERLPDWVATWQVRIEQANDWRQVVSDAVADLAPAVFSAATHGLLRVAHAVRALERTDTAERREELAWGLAVWSAGRQTLPGDPGSNPSDSIDAAHLIAELEVVPPAERKWGLFTEGALKLESHASFPRAIDRLAVPREVGASDVSDLTGAMLDFYFESPLLRIAYIHTITAPSSIRLIAPLLSPETLRDLYRYGVQAVAALHAISRLPSETSVDGEVEHLAQDAEALRDRAADSLEDHVIKFTEACLREDAARPDPRWRVAAADSVIAEERRQP